MGKRHSAGLAKKGLTLLFFVALATNANQQDGSLNSYHGENSTTNSHNETTTTDTSTTNNYNGAGSSSEMPVGSAISPSYMSNGHDSCLQGTSGSLQTVAIGISTGHFQQDPDCQMRKNAKVLADLGLKVAAVSVMCQGSVEVFRSMLLAGSPCPVISNGRLVAGRRGLMVIKQQPELYIPDYKENADWYNGILQIGEVSTDVEEDSKSVSDMFRSTKQ